MTFRVTRAGAADRSTAWEILQEYNVSTHVAVRDDPVAFEKYLDGPGGFWLAYAADEIAGCVALRALAVDGERACEVKRLYVRPAHRGLGIAVALMDAVEAYARNAGYDAIYLDTRDDLDVAIRFYDRRGYERIGRYNDNPEATIFMRRPLR